MTSITISNTIREIGEEAFNNNTSLSTLEIPKVENIKSSAFYKCTSLETLDLPVVLKVEELAFADCDKLTVTVNATTPPSIDSDVFNDVVKILVPSSTLSTFQSDSD